MKTRRRAPYILILLILAVLGVLALCFAPRGAIETPQVLLPPDTTATPDASAGQSGDALTAVKVDPQTVQAAIATLARTDSYSRTLTAENFWSGGSASTQIDVCVSGSSARLTIKEAKREKNVLIRDGALWIWYSDSDSIYNGPASDRAADEYQTLLTYEDILDMPASSITDAGYEKLGDEYCIYAVYTSGELGYVSKVWISVSTGLLMGSETLNGDTVVYRLTSSAPDITTPDESVFELEVRYQS